MLFGASIATPAGPAATPLQADRLILWMTRRCSAFESVPAFDTSTANRCGDANIVAETLAVTIRLLTKLVDTGVPSSRTWDPLTKPAPMSVKFTVPVGATPEPSEEGT